MAFLLSYKFYFVSGIQAIGDVWAQALLHIDADGTPVQGSAFCMMSLQGVPEIQIEAT